jgi:hypothetical protein
LDAAKVGLVDVLEGASKLLEAFQGIVIDAHS